MVPQAIFVKAVEPTLTTDTAIGLMSELYVNTDIPDEHTLHSLENVEWCLDPLRPSAHYKFPA